MLPLSRTIPSSLSLSKNDMEVTVQRSSSIVIVEGLSAQFMSRPALPELRQNLSISHGHIRQ